MKVRKIFRWTLCIVAAALMILYESDALAQPRGNSLDLKVSSKYGDLAELGNYVPLEVQITNNSKEFEGELRVGISTLTNNRKSTENFLTGIDEKSLKLVKTVKVPKGITYVDMMVPVMFENSNIQVELNKSGENIYTTHLILSAEANSNNFDIAIIGKSTSNLEYFNEISLYEYADFTTNTVEIPLEDVPKEEYAYDVFEMIIISDVQLADIDLKQKQVIKNWVKNGGVLIFGSPLEEEELKTLSEDLSIEEFADIDKDMKNLNSLYMYYDGYIGVPKNDLSTLGENVNEYSNIDYVKNLIIETVGIERLKYDDMYRLYGTHNNYWDVSSTVDLALPQREPSYKKYLVIIAVYLLISGPVLFLTLKKAKRSRKIYIYQIILALTATFIVYLLGNNTRYIAPFITYFNIETYGKETSTTSYFSVQAPFNEKYDIYLDNAYSYKYVYEPLYLSEQKDGKIFLDDKVIFNLGQKENQLTIDNEAAFEKNYFIAEQFKDNTRGEIKAEVNMFENELSGYIKNDSDITIENGLIVTNNKVIEVGDIAPGADIDLSEFQVNTYSSERYYELTEKLAATMLNEQSDKIDNKLKEYIYNFYFKNYFETYTKKCVLIGFKEEKNNFSLQLDSGFKSYGRSLVEVPVELNLIKGNKEYIPDICTYSNDIYSYGYQMYMDESTFTLKFDKDYSDITLIKNDYEYINNDYSEEFDGKMYFYNVDRGRFALISQNVQILDSDFMKNYISNDNELVIKYVQSNNNNDEEIKEQVLPVFSAVGGR